MTSGINDRGSNKWRQSVNDLILEGYGSEDIAIIKECKISVIQDHINKLRKSGVLAHWFKQ